MDKSLSDYGLLTLGSTFRKLSDELTREVDKLYQSQQLDIAARQLPCLMLIRDNGQISVTQLAQKLGQTHPAVVQLSKKLIANGWVFDLPDPKDDRRRLMSLTPQGYTYLDQMEPCLKAIRKTLESALGPDFNAFIQQLTALESFLHHESFAAAAARVVSLNRLHDFSVHEFTLSDSDDFRDLNYQWLEEYFYIEELDKKVLGNPQKTIIEPGGRIFMGKRNGENIATCALIKADDQRVELSKMAVDKRYRSSGLGRQLLHYVLEAFKQSEYETLFLESNSKLVPAIKLYESLGFVHKPNPTGPSKYDRADVYMEYQG